MKRFAYDSRLPVINENCPACFEQPKERHRIKKLLAKEESLFPHLYANLRRTLVPLMLDESYAQLSSITKLVDAKKHQRTKPTRGAGGAVTGATAAGSDNSNDPNTSLWRNATQDWLGSIDTAALQQELARRGIDTSGAACASVRVASQDDDGSKEVEGAWARRVRAAFACALQRRWRCSAAG